jgi:hypothetical protein
LDLTGHRSDRTEIAPAWAWETLIIVIALVLANGVSRVAGQSVHALPVPLAA